MSTNDDGVPPTTLNDETKRVDNDKDDSKDALLLDDDESKHRKRHEKEPEKRYKKWLEDRVTGHSKYSPSDRPPHFLCFVPKPVYRFSRALEMNSVMERLGKIGLFDPLNIKARKICIGIGLATNAIGVFLIAFSAFAISADFGILQAASFSKGTLRNASNLVTGNKVPDSDGWVGLRYIAIAVSDDAVPRTVIGFDEVCDQNVIFSNFADPEKCDHCNENSRKMVSSLFISLVTYVPNLTTDFLRQWPNYDVNCQKVFASFFCILSIALSIRTWLVYENQCFASFLDGDIYWSSNGTILSPGDSEATFNATVTYGRGNALWTLIVASSLKVVDMFCNLVIPTPSITRDHDEQEEYERMFYGDQAEEVEEDEEVGEDRAPEQMVDEEDEKMDVSKSIVSHDESIVEVST